MDERNEDVKDIMEAAEAERTTEENEAPKGDEGKKKKKEKTEKKKKEKKEKGEQKGNFITNAWNRFAEGKTKAELAEIVVVVLLGIVTLLTAWASWMGSLHTGIQQTYYTKSNNLSSDGNSMWTEATENLGADMQLWNEIDNLKIESTFAEKHGDKEEVEKCDWKIEQLLINNGDVEFIDAVEWAESQDEDVTPFDMEGYVEGYYEDAQATIDESTDAMEQGQKVMASADAFGLVSVLYAVILFLLGISGSIKDDKNRKALIVISIVGIIITTIYMITLPLPEGFNIFSFHGGE